MSITTVITPTFLKTNYLFGIDLTDDSGTAFPDSLFTQAIKGAAAMIEGELDISLTYDSFDERIDAYRPDQEGFFLLNLLKRPVWEVTQLGLRFGSFQEGSVPATWALVREPLSGQIQIIPGPEATFISTYTSGYPLYGYHSLTPNRYVPGWFRVVYKAGYDGTAGREYPDDIIDAVSLLASMLPLDTAGDLIVGAGIASKSTIMDGLSTSINTTSSATNSGYGARALQYNKRLKLLMHSMRAKYRGNSLAVI